jgi:hypothetical protein
MKEGMNEGREEGGKEGGKKEGGKGGREEGRSDLGERLVFSIVICVSFIFCERHLFPVNDF